MDHESNGLRRYMALWIFLAAQTAGSIWWMATLTNEVANMHEVGGVPISTEARERLSALEAAINNHETRINGMENRERDK